MDVYCPAATAMYRPASTSPAGIPSPGAPADTIEKPPRPPPDEAEDLSLPFLHTYPDRGPRLALA